MAAGILTVGDPNKATRQLAMQPLLELFHGEALGIFERCLGRLRRSLSSSRGGGALDIANA